MRVLVDHSVLIVHATFQIISQILLHQRPTDRLVSSLTCRSWAEASSHSQLWDDIWCKFTSADMETVIPVLMKSTRQYRDLRTVLKEYR